MFSWLNKARKAIWCELLDRNFRDPAMAAFPLTGLIIGVLYVLLVVPAVFFCGPLAITGLLLALMLFSFAIWCVVGACMLVRPASRLAREFILDIRERIKNEDINC